MQTDPNALPRLTLILGGAASGKSRVAEQLVFATGRPRIYLATSQAGDAEMSAKITRHRAQRGPDWTTIEEPLELTDVIRNQDGSDVVLLDCATLWLTNWMCDNRDMDAAAQAFLAMITPCDAPLVVVSNDLGGGLVPPDAMSRQFQQVHGKLNQLVAAQADLVVAVTAGLPHVLKGVLP